MFVPAGVLYLCCADRTTPIGPISFHQDTTNTSHRTLCHQAQMRQLGTHCRRNRNPPSALTTETEARGQPPGARALGYHTQERNRV